MNPFHHSILTAIQNAPNLYYDGEDFVGEFKPIDPGFNFMCGKNPVDGYYYFTLMGDGGSPENRKPYIYKFDIDTLSVVDSASITRPGVTSTYDEHLKAVINFDASGNALLLMEQGDESTELSDGHNTVLLLYKTTTPGDLSSFELIHTFTGQFAYPKLWVFGNTYFAKARGITSGLDLTQSTIFKSTDSGSNWTEHIVMDLPSNIRAYTNTIHSLDTNEIIIVLNARNDTYGAFESVSVLKSSDGVIWSNWEGTFSKNVDTEGALTYTEIQDNMLVWKINAANDLAVNFEGGIVKNGEIQVLISSSETTGVVVDGNTQQRLTDLRLYSFSGGWGYIDLNELLPDNYLLVWARERIMQFVADLDKDFIFFLDRTDTSNCELHKYSSSDGFQTYADDVIMQDEGNYYYGSNAFNITNQGEHLVILTDIQGDMTNYDSWTNLKIIDPN